MRSWLVRSWCVLGLVAALVAAPTAARADNDAVQFFTDIHVTPQNPVHDAVCFFCSVHDDGTITHDVVVFFGSIDITGSAQHDVVSLFGSVDAHDNASIAHDLVSIFGSLQLGENVTVGHDAVAVFSSIEARPSATVGGSRVSIPAILFWGPAMIPIFLIVLIVYIIRERSHRWPPPGYPPPPMR